jgi:hypothetical protein
MTQYAAFYRGNHQFSVVFLDASDYMSGTIVTEDGGWMER